MNTEIIKQAKNEVMPIVELAKQLIIKTDEDQTVAKSFIKKIDEKFEELDMKFKFTETKDKTNAAHKAACATFNAFSAPFKDAKEIIAEKNKKYELDKALKAQRAAEAAEAKRQEAERKEREKLEEMARKAEEMGKEEKADMLREQAETVSIAPTFTQPQASKKLITKARVKNMMQLCKLIGEGVIPFSIVQINQAQLNSWAKMQDVKSKYNGIELYQDVNKRVC